SKADLPPQFARTGLTGAFAPAWSPDGQWIVFGVGTWFQERAHFKATLMRVRRDGTGLEALTDGAVHSGFPSYSADGKQVVYRVWGEDNKGLRILNLEDRTTRVLTKEYDNLPSWSPDGRRILFTRKVDEVNFDIFTIKPTAVIYCGSPRTVRMTVMRSGPRTAKSCGTAASTASGTKSSSLTTRSSPTARSSSWTP